jgi:CspA family cold shock protein
MIRERARLSPQETPMATGTVKWFNPSKGYGFIQPEDGGKDVFVHISALERAGIKTVREGQRLEFELAPGRDGRTAAEEIKLLD